MNEIKRSYDGLAERPRFEQALDAALRAAPAQTVARPATFAAQADKRRTLDMALDHLQAQAPTPAEPGPHDAGTVHFPAASRP